jgi:hypothetical protein
MDFVARFRLPSLGTRSAEQEEESRLLKLYWNRAELKKELATLDDSVHQLRDRLKQQEGATGRVEEEHRALEVLLGSPEYGFQALVHYQLRALWRACHAQIEQFGAELARQREERERKRQVQDYQVARAQRLRVIGEREAALEADVASAEAAVREGEGRLSRLQRFWHYFRRQEVETQVERLRGVLAERAATLAEARIARKALEHEPWPDFVGLSLDGKRSINLAVIAYAQLLVCRLAEGGLARRSWEAQRQSVRDSHYGTRGECLAMMNEIRDALARVRDATDVIVELKQRAERVRISAQYAEADDPVPLPETLPGNEPSGARSLDEPNVLRENYWDLFRILRT